MDLHVCLLPVGTLRDLPSPYNPLQELDKLKERVRIVTGFFCIPIG